MNFAENILIYPWQPAAWLRVRGEDALNFLQGQFTNDLRKPMANGAVYGLWLNHRGKVVADSFVRPVTEAPGEFWVGSYFCPAAIIRERLESCIVADDVELEDQTAAWAAVTIFGDSEILAQVPAVPGGLRMGGRRDRTVHAEWVFPATQRPTVLAALVGARELSATEILARRVAAGIPAVPADVGPGELPNEGGLEDEAISYTKGCYLGQEVMARLKSMGQVRRRLLRVQGAGAIPALPANLHAGDRIVGELRSAVAQGDGFAGLALVTLLQLPADRRLALAPGAPATISVEASP